MWVECVFSFRNLGLMALQKLPQSTMSATAASSYGSCKAEVVVPDQFPAGLRVLVVDDDTTCLRILEQMLRRCMYRGKSTARFLHYALIDVYYGHFVGFLF